MSKPDKVRYRFENYTAKVLSDGKVLDSMLDWILILPDSHMRFAIKRLMLGFVLIVSASAALLLSDLG